MDFYGLSATAFSEEISFNRSTISHLLSGRNKPSLEFVMKVVKHFPEVELYWLLNGKGSFPAQRDLAATSSEPVTNLAEAKIKTPSQPTAPSIPPSEVKPTAKAIDRIVIFYADGTFKEYRP